MAEFDLIPADYAHGRLLRQRVRHFLVALAAITCIVALAWLGLRSLIFMERGQLARLQERARSIGEAKGRLEQDRGRILSARRQLEALDELRGRDRVLVFLRAIDAAYVEGMWFDEVRFFRREKVRVPTPGSPAAQAPGAAAGNGDAAAKPGAAALPEIEQAAEIAGYAMNHSALAEFVRRLAEQPGISGVRLVDSGMRTTADVPAIEGRIALVVAGKSGSAQ